MSGAVGSTPRYTRRGFPVFTEFASFCFNSSSGIISATPFFRYSSCSSTGLNLLGVIKLSIRPEDSPPGDPVFSLENNLHGLAVNPVFFLQNAFRKRVLIVAIEHRDHRLQDDRSRIQILIHEMHRASREFHPMFERLLLRFQPWKSRQERWMNIQNPLRERGDKIRR